MLDPEEIAEISDGPAPSEEAVAALLNRVGRRVRAARAAAGLSRRALSDLSGVSPRYIAQLESGAGNISIGLLFRIASALAMRVDALLGDGAPEGAEVAQLAALYKAADPGTQARVLDLLNPAHVRAARAERICLIGLRGAGKSTLGPLIAEDFGMPFVELNDEIEASAGMPVAEIIALYGEEGYRQLEAETLDAVVARHPRLILAVAGGIVSSPGAFAQVLAQTHTVWIKAQPAEHMERVRAQGDLRPMEGNPQAMAQLRQILASREALYGQAGYQLDTTGKSVATAHAELRKLLQAAAVIGSRGA